jgi:hypothetical protein
MVCNPSCVGSRSPTRRQPASASSHRATPRRSLMVGLYYPAVLGAGLVFILTRLGLKFSEAFAQASLCVVASSTGPYQSRVTARHAMTANRQALVVHRRRDPSVTARSRFVAAR